MAYTAKEVIDLVAIRVQEIIVPKVEDFTEGVDKEVQLLRLEMKDATQFNSAIQKGLNEMKTEMAILEPMKKQVTELYAQFCKNGYMQRFNQMAARLEEFFRTRFETCPVAQDVREIKKNWDDFRTEAVKRAEGRLHTRKQDKHWTVSTTIAAIVAVAAVLTLLTKLLGWW